MTSYTCIEGSKRCTNLFKLDENTIYNVQLWYAVKADIGTHFSICVDFLSSYQTLGRNFENPVLGFRNFYRAEELIKIAVIYEDLSSNFS